jgi:MtN3 and saliva related transmembrane protein
MADTLAVMATAWGLLMALSPILQIRRMLTTGSSADYSVGYLGILLVGFVLWFSYGTSIGNPALMISNLAALTFGLVTMAVALRLRRRPLRRVPVSTGDPPEDRPVEDVEG